MKTPFNKNVKECVEYILKNFSITRKNDNALILYYWLVCDRLPLLNQYLDEDDPLFHKKFNELLKATTPETITRARRLIQHDEGKYVDRAIENKRRALEKMYRDTAKSILDFY